ncbi:exonuclease family protein (plasmid) [Butyrivibrio proteoclasticus B316]|uniref:Exonuclease family protein n=1 Tax=Butyrivibrio proteoclasticus (strain ATCC 51982 / DSM 14932 / B316) TaxID=515622 RepID=E0S459_BUTPB|nr:3'-5' exonuclease [Butyrivibrio proteoclasticus]ADL36191.1 exonuclease family protein [Butyrivibrio proteoclasticus B316]
MNTDKRGRTWYPIYGYSTLQGFANVLRNNKVPIIIYDTETTGTGKKAYIVQISALKLSPGNPYYIVDTLDQYIRPPIPMPAAASAVNHITDEFLEDKPSEEIALSWIQNFFGDPNDSVIAGYNHISFDNKMMNNMYQRAAGLTFDPKWNVDALVMARCLVDRNEITDGRFTLASIAETYGIKTDEDQQLHNAMTDIQVTMKVMWALINDYVDSGLEQVYLSQSTKPIIQILGAPKRQTYSKLSDYVYFDVICCGETGQIRYEVYDKRFVEVTQTSILEKGNMEQFIVDAQAMVGGDINRFKG